MIAGKNASVINSGSPVTVGEDNDTIASAYNTSSIYLEKGAKAAAHNH